MSLEKKNTGRVQPVLITDSKAVSWGGGNIIIIILFKLSFPSTSQNWTNVFRRGCVKTITRDGECVQENNNSVLLVISHNHKEMRALKR